MMYYSIEMPTNVRAKLTAMERKVKDLSERSAKLETAIATAKQRSTGGFTDNQVYLDLLGAIDRMVTQEGPKLQAQLSSAKATLAKCENWLEQLPPGTVLKEVEVDVNGFDRATVLRLIDEHEDELKTLRAVPLLDGSIRFKAETYVKKLARLKVSGISKGEELRVECPNDRIAQEATLRPNELIEAIVAEAQRMASTPMKLPDRKVRIAWLEREIVKRQRQLMALGGATHDLPPQVVLGVKVATPHTTTKVERQPPKVTKVALQG
jgi:hypothetical protein